MWQSIGILSAIALPQYRLAVEKARLTEGLIIARAIKEVQDGYYLANNAYATPYDDLDITLPGNANGQNLTLSSGERIFLRTGSVL